jgi:hypothetical protein
MTILWEEMVFFTKLAAAAASSEEDDDDDTHQSDAAVVITKIDRIIVLAAIEASSLSVSLCAWVNVVWLCKTRTDASKNIQRNMPKNKLIKKIIKCAIAYWS